MRGLLFTAGVVAYGGLVFTYVIACWDGIGEGADYLRVVEFERSSGNNVNIVSGLDRIFKEHSGITFEQSSRSVSINGVLPADNGDYSQRVSEYSAAVVRYLPESSVHCLPYPSFTTEYGLNLSRRTDYEVVVSLPRDVSEISLIGRISGNITSCDLDSSKGRLFFTGAFHGSDSGCERSASIDHQNRTVFKAGGLSAELYGGVLRLHGIGPVAYYNLTVVFNESIHRKSPNLEADVSSSAGSTRKTSGVILS